MRRERSPCTVGFITMSLFSASFAGPFEDVLFPFAASFDFPLPTPDERRSRASRPVLREDGRDEAGRTLGDWAAKASTGFGFSWI